MTHARDPASGSATRVAPRRPIVWTALLVTCTGCTQLRALDPASPEASDIAAIAWVLFGIATIVCLVVFALLWAAVRRAPRGGDEGRADRFVLFGGAVIPGVILTAAAAFTLVGLAAFDTAPGNAHTTVRVTGHMFWWEIHYPEEGVVTANELHLPAGEPVRVELESEDVIHSFWVPRLHGKIELVPGRTNVLHLQADRPGTFFGKCAEYCGAQHANMEFTVVAQEPEAFDAWLQAQAEDAAEPATAQARAGRDVFENAPCAQCHTIRGVSDASARAGPDLTHLASRDTLAARTLPNTRGHLGGWILDPQRFKPGARMPAVNLSSEDFQALLTYLNGLE